MGEWKIETFTSVCTGVLNAIFCQLSVENAMANSAMNTKEKIEAKHIAMGVPFFLGKTLKRSPISSNLVLAVVVGSSKTILITTLLKHWWMDIENFSWNYHISCLKNEPLKTAVCLHFFKMAFCSAVTLCFASIFSLVSAALLAIAFSTDNWQNIAFKTPVPTEVGLFQSQINKISTNKPQMVMSIVEKSLGYWLST